MNNKELCCENYIWYFMRRVGYSYIFSVNYEIVNVVSLCFFLSLLGLYDIFF